jgi:lipoprotein NlpD
LATRLSENNDMNLRRCAWIFLLSIIVSGCGVSPTVRVEPTTASAVAPRVPGVAETPRPAIPTRDAHLVTKGDTLYSIAFRNGLDVRELVEWNHIVAPYTIYPGQSLRLKPDHRRTTPVSAAQTAPASPPMALPSTAQSNTATATLGTRPVVDNAQPVRVEPLAASSTSAMATTRPGTVLATAPRQPGSLIAAIEAAPVSAPPPGQNASPGYKPAPATSKPLPATASGVSPSTNGIGRAPTASAAPSVIAATTIAPPVLPATVRVDSSGPSQSREGISWRWPTTGNVIGRFVTGDPTQQGVDISGKLGQSVFAVAQGDVVYSGNGLLGYGEMIIVQHSPDYLSAYGHNQRRLVAEGDKVRAGQVIAEMGQRGSQVMLHFEVRRRGKPVDPLAYLPAR